MYNQTKEETKASQSWWRNLSNNQMKTFEKKYFPNHGNYAFHDGLIFEIWESEGRPEPQALIPVI